MGKKTCMETALNKLNYRMRTEGELRKTLEELDYSGDEIRDTLDELKDFGYLDDLRYSKEFLRNSRKKSWSLSRIRRALREKGVDPEVIDNAFYDAEDSGELTEEGLSLDDREAALQAGIKMAERELAGGKYPDDRFSGKLGRKLTSLGYDTGCCFYVINRIREQFGKNEEQEEEL